SARRWRPCPWPPRRPRWRRRPPWWRCASPRARRRRPPHSLRQAPRSGRAPRLPFSVSAARTVANATASSFLLPRDPMPVPSARTSVLPRRTAVSAALALVLAQPPARAQDADAASVATLPAISVSGDTPLPTLRESTATGSFLQLTPFEPPASIDLNTNAQLRQRGDVTVMDAVTQAAGISAFRHPGNGGSSLSSRGFTDSNSVAILYDGLRQYGGLGQTFVYDPWSVDRIEVLRGPASVLYGEGAIGGVVNVIPKKPTRGPIENEIQAAVGTHDTQRLAFGSGGALDERWSYRLDISGNRSDADMSL